MCVYAWECVVELGMVEHEGSLQSLYVMFGMVILAIEECVYMSVCESQIKRVSKLFSKEVIKHEHELF